MFGIPKDIVPLPCYPAALLNSGDIGTIFACKQTVDPEIP